MSITAEPIEVTREYLHLHTAKKGREHVKY